VAPEVRRIHSAEVPPYAAHPLIQGIDYAYPIGFIKDIAGFGHARCIDPPIIGRRLKVNVSGVDIGQTDRPQLLVVDGVQRGGEIL
jgi:hypothetical protein